MPHVMLRKNWNGTFKRAVRDKSGKILKTLAFTPGEIVDLRDSDVEAVLGDLGKALLPMEWSEQFGKFLPVPVGEIDPSNPLASATTESADAKPPETTDDPATKTVTAGGQAPELSAAVAATSVPQATDAGSVSATTEGETPTATQDEAVTDGTSNAGKRSRK